MATPSATTVATCGAPFARYGHMYGFNMALVDEQFASLAVLSETGDSFKTAVWAQEESGAYSLNARWREIRHDPSKTGRMCRVVVKMGGPEQQNSVHIAACYAYSSQKGQGLAYKTLEVAAAFASAVNGRIDVCAIDDGVHVWLALGAQPNDNDFKKLHRKLTRLDISPRSRRLAHNREFVALKERSERDFKDVADALGPWEGGWTVDQAREIARKAAKRELG